MTRQGNVSPELAQLLREIASRIEDGSATEYDASTLRRLARQAGGEDRDWIVKVHRTKGNPAHGSAGVDQRFEMARRVQEYRKLNGGTLENAYRALDGMFNVGHSSIKKAWQEMGPLLNMRPKDQELILFFKRVAARGSAAAPTIRRVKK